MDAEHRHELKKNELADWIAHFPDFVRRNLRTIIGVVLIVTAGVVYVYGKSIRGEAQAQQQAEAISLIEQFNMSKLNAIQNQQQDIDSGDVIMIAANRLEMGVDNTKSPQISAMLLIKHGEALRADLHYRAAEMDADIVGQRVKEARQAYEKALLLAEGNATLTAMARFGLGLCAEEVGEYITAEEIYNGIIADADYAATVFPAQARQRLDNMQDNQMQFTFAATAPKPEAAAATPLSISPDPAAAEPVVIGDATAAPAETQENESPVEDAPQTDPSNIETDGDAAQQTESPDTNP
ncbi:MAG: tetratricopeptide repeat protein [Phycisphaerae bacterium]|nr:tetratricopeptide repeat protein [Phycisphaerae bacterium]